MLSRKKRADRKAELFGDLVLKIEQRQQRAFQGVRTKVKATSPGASAHGSVFDAIKEEQSQLINSSAARHAATSAPDSIPEVRLLTLGSGPSATTLEEKCNSFDDPLDELRA